MVADMGWQSTWVLVIEVYCVSNIIHSQHFSLSLWVWREIKWVFLLFLFLFCFLWRGCAPTICLFSQLYLRFNYYMQPNSRKRAAPLERWCGAGVLKIKKKGNDVLTCKHCMWKWGIWLGLRRKFHHHIFFLLALIPMIRTEMFFVVVLEHLDEAQTGTTGLLWKKRLNWCLHLFKLNRNGELRNH